MLITPIYANYVLTVYSFYVNYCLFLSYSCFRTVYFSFFFLGELLMLYHLKLDNGVVEVMFSLKLPDDIFPLPDFSSCLALAVLLTL